MSKRIASKKLLIHEAEGWLVDLGNYLLKCKNDVPEWQNYPSDFIEQIRLPLVWSPQLVRR